MATRQTTYGASEGVTRARGSVLAAGFVLFAATMMIVGGIFNAIQGLAAVLEEQFFVVGENYAYDVDVSTWGWIHIATGIVVALTGFALLSGAIWARILAIFFVVWSAMVNFVFIPYQPLWSIVLLVINGLVIWALITHFDVEEA